MLSASAIKAMKKDELVAAVERLQQEQVALQLDVAKAKDETAAAEGLAAASLSGKLKETFPAFVHAHSVQMLAMRTVLAQLTTPLIPSIEFSKITMTALDREAKYLDLVDKIMDLSASTSGLPLAAGAKKPHFKPLPEAQWLNLDRMGHRAVEDWLENFEDILSLAGFEPASQGEECLKALLTSCTPGTRQKLKNMGAQDNFPAYVQKAKLFTKKRVNKALERMNMQSTGPA